MAARTLGIDIGAETIKVAEVRRTEDGRLVPGRMLLAEHHKEPALAIARLLSTLDWDGVDAAAATGRASRLLRLERVPTKAARARGALHRWPELVPGMVVSIGAHGFGVLEFRPGGTQVWRENSRCSQGTGNFLRQLVERFDLTVEEASRLAAGVERPAVLSGRCPVILKTDMTHLANKGEDRAAILAGLYDAVCDNVAVLIKPRLAEGARPKVLLTGGVARAERVRAYFRRFLERRGMQLLDVDPEDALFVEALGAALVAADHAADAPRRPPPLDRLFREESDAHFELRPSLRSALDRVHRMPSEEPLPADEPCDVVLGFDIGSTGSKLVAIRVDDARLAWKGYARTLGDPVGAARRLARQFLEETRDTRRVRAAGATGSGREIVGSLLSTCYGPEPVFVLNEIAAHAEGALHHDPRVDTIFEIGGQDAKYIRLDGGRIVDAAMNEACSAGTGSFIEEQGRKFAEVRDVVQMNEVALAADRCTALGQHCSVFMAEVIDEAVSAGVSTKRIVAGIYDSVVQNYLNRVKGSRTVGERIFCQGMPFSSDALAAAVARQTGREVVVPPDPGLVGALGIALLARREARLADAPLDLERFLAAEVEGKDTFVCTSTKGCGGAGNRCRIDRLKVVVEGKRRRFLWGGNCSLYDRGTNRRKLPDRAPDPFRERAELLEAVLRRAAEAGRDDMPVVALTHEFALKGLAPFFATFLARLGFRLRVPGDAGHATLKRGIEEAQVPFCAPMQLYLGVMAELLDGDPDILLVPRLRELPRVNGETDAPTCPIVQGSPDIVKRLGGAARARTRIVVPRVDMGPGNLRSERFVANVRRLAAELGVEEGWRPAYEAAVAAQRAFDAELLRIGRRALDFAREHDVPAVVVLGRPYTIANRVLNSNVPNLLREQGAIGVPVDCFPLGDDVPVFEDLYWGYAQRNLRAAWGVRRTDGVYAVYCSNYSCGPDSFNLHFFAYTMEGKPFAIIETDGHSGDAGTKTRIEAFLYCVEGDRRAPPEHRSRGPLNDFRAIERDRQTLDGVREAGEVLLIPRMGPGAEMLATAMRAEGIRAEALPMPDREVLGIGRRHTSGKECVPMTITLGSVLQRLERDPHERFALLMPTAPGPCRFGVYNLLHKIVADKTGHRPRLRVVSPSSSDYFAGVSPSFRVRALVAFIAADLLQAGLLHVRPVEREPGLAESIYRRHFREAQELLAEARAGGMIEGLDELAHGMFGVRAVLRRAAREYAEAMDPEREVPTVAVVGEIYVRLDPFANDFVVDQLERRGIRAALAPFVEWLEYTSALKAQRRREGRPYPADLKPATALATAIEKAAIERAWLEFGRPLGWHRRTSVEDSLAAATPYISPELYGEAVLTLGGPVHEHDQGVIDGALIVGPHECMPTKIAESQLAHVAEEKGLLSLTLPLNGDPVDPEVLDRFAFEVHERFRARRAAGRGDSAHREPPPPPGATRRMLLLESLRLLHPLARVGRRGAAAGEAPRAR